MATEEPQFVQILSDGPDAPLYALDEAGVVWRWERQPIQETPYSEVTGQRMVWVPLPTERRA